MIALPGKEEALRQELLRLIEPTRREEGCLQYDLHVAMDNPGRFVFYENWTSRAALDKHLGSKHLQAFLTASKDLREEPRIGTFHRIA
jgi:quinol monooxygenase YgiN